MNQLILLVNIAAWAIVARGEEVKCYTGIFYNGEQMRSNCTTDMFLSGSKFCVSGKTYTVESSFVSCVGATCGSTVNHNGEQGDNYADHSLITFGECPDCIDQLPLDYGTVGGPGKCIWPCSKWASLGHCTYDWSRYPHCTPTTNGLVKDYCRLSCNNCA